MLLAPTAGLLHWSHAAWLSGCLRGQLESISPWGRCGPRLPRKDDCCCEHLWVDTFRCLSATHVWWKLVKTCENYWKLTESKIDRFESRKIPGNFLECPRCENFSTGTEKGWEDPAEALGAKDKTLRFLNSFTEAKATAPWFRGISTFSGRNSQTFGRRPRDYGEGTEFCTQQQDCHPLVGIDNSLGLFDWIIWKALYFAVRLVWMGHGFHRCPFAIDQQRLTW